MLRIATDLNLLLSFIVEEERKRKIVEDHDNLERVKRFELSTPTLARLCSTTELHPLIEGDNLYLQRINCNDLIQIL